MFRSKKDVDSHVRDVFSKCKLENERLKLCFGIAKQYSSIREFDSARRYLETYLNSNPTNLGEAHKLMGDIQQELGDYEKALESYKASYSEGKARDSLNRVCDLLTRGFGNKETAESKKKWFDMQKSTLNNNPLSAASSTSSSPVVPRRTPINVGGPPKGGFNHSLFTNGSPSPLVSSTSKTNGASVDLQLRYLERRLDDGLGKILEQNTLVLEQMLKFKEDMKDLADKVEHVAVNQEQMQVEIKELKEKQEETQALTIQSKQSQQAMQQMVSASSCKKCEGRPLIKEVHQPCTSVVELTALKEQMERLESRTTKAIENLEASFRLPQSTPPFNLGFNTGIAPPVGIQNLSFPTTLPPMTHFPDTVVSNPLKVPTPSGVVPASPQSIASSTVVVSPRPPIIAQTPIHTTSAIAHTPPTILDQWTPQNALTPTQNATPPASMSVLDYTTPKKSEENKESVFPGLNLSGKFSFADLAKNNNSPASFSFGTTTGNSTFSGVGAPLFSSLTPVNKNAEGANTSGHGEEGDDDFVPTAEFQPVIPLPPLVEVKKGDEDENTIVEYRAKLYRFVSETKEWKERGVGNIKLLQSKINSKKCRVVMWREKVGKLACNFSLYPDIKVENYQGNAKVLCWKCEDFIEEPAWETFTLRFGNEENCAHFKTEMERLAKLTVATDNNSPSSVNKEIKTSTLVKTEEKQVPLSQLFKKPEGSWNCEFCYCRNDKDITACIACQSVRPGYEHLEKPSTTENEIPQPTFSFGFPTASTTAPTFNFGFANTNSNTTAAPTAVVDGITSTKADESKEPAFPGLNLTGKFSFADLAKNNNSPASFSFGTTTGNTTFSGVGAPLFSSLTPVNKNAEGANTSGHGEEGDDDFVPTAEFQPVIPLPPLVEVKKGDEDENTIAEYRGKLYRFISETKEWKERGVGNIKLLQSKINSKKCRVVMWREKVGKLACNFNLYPDIKVENYQGNAKVLCWKCKDSAEEPAWETFTLRFGNEENCAHFKTEMERLAKLTVAADDSFSSSIGNEMSASAPVKVEEKQVPLSQMFKKPEGSWNCESCYCTNSKDLTACIACQTIRPGFEHLEKPSTTENEIPQPTFSFGFPAASTTAPTFNFGFANTTAVVAPLANEVTTVPVKSEESTEPVFPGLNLTGKFSFADLAKNNNSPASFSFGTTTGSTTFSGVGAPLFSSLTPVNANTSGHGEEGDDDFVPTAEFQPVIPLPPLVEVKKGDEDENTIAEYRAKLYRFVSEAKEWKERGVGNIKLLQSKTDAKKCRVVMWREKIGKLACNFSLYPDIKVENYQSNPKVLCWKCQDFAEDTAWETFTLRFGNEENCAHFKTEMERLAKLTVAADDNSSFSMGNEKNVSAPAKAEEKQVPLSQMFKKQEGSWNCESCYCTNNQAVAKCIACQTVRPGSEQQPRTTENTTAHQEDGPSSCPGCVGCNPDTYKIPEAKKPDSEEVIGLSLEFDASNLSPAVVNLSEFTSSSVVGAVSSDKKTEAGREHSGLVGGLVDSNNVNLVDSTVNNSFSNFSFSFQSSENTTPNPFQLKTPTFSFKPDGNSSIFGGGGSIFTPPVGGTTPGSTPSPFVSPFAQQNSLLNNSSPQSVPFIFSQPLFNNSAQSADQSLDNNDPPVQREEDEYEDVDDEEEDECMFEDDVHVFIQDGAVSGSDFSDKGEAVVRVLYDGESYCARLVIMIDGEIIAEHLVAVETILEPKGELTYEWTGICNYESPVKSRIKAVFSDEEAFKSFSSVMADSLDFAEQAGVTEAVLLDETSGGD